MIFTDRNGKKVIKPKDKKVDLRLSVYGLAIQNNQILMVHNANNKLWELPGGGVEKNETDDMALQRKYLEETGFIIKEMDKNPIKILFNNFYSKNIETYYKNEMRFYAITHIVKKQDCLMDSTKIIDIAWVDIFSLTKNNCRDIYLKVINNFIKKIISQKICK